MPIVKIEIGDQQLNDDQLREELSAFLSNDEAYRLTREMAQLMKSGDLGFWLSPRLMREVKAFAAKQQGESSQGIVKVDETAFVSWLLKAGSMELNPRWEVESLPNNGGIYRMLLEGGQDEKGVHNNQG